MKRKTDSTRDAVPDEASKPQRVEIMWNGQTARPFEHELQPWFDAGWKLKETNDG